MKELTEEKPFELDKGAQLINNKYKVIGKIGTGTFSTVHAINMIKGQKQIVRAIKESSTVKEPQISTQISVLKNIKDGNSQQPGFAQIFQYGYEQNYHYLVMTLLGPNLEQMLKLCGGTFSLKTTLMISLQILERLQVLHSYGYIYGDIKPQNFLVGLGTESPIIHMIDFGKCRRYRNKTNGQHIYYKQNINYTFCPIFASINAHNSIQASRRDDIESFLYLFTYLKLGKLPWLKANQAKRNKNQMNIGQIKKRLTPEMLCHKLPIQIIDLLYYIRSVEFYEKPDYNYIKKMLYRCLEREQFDNTIIYDWNKLQQVDFKVYSGQPKIVLKGGSNYPDDDTIIESRVKAEDVVSPQEQIQQGEQDQNSKLCTQ